MVIRFGRVEGAYSVGGQAVVKGVDQFIYVKQVGQCLVYFFVCQFWRFIVEFDEVVYECWWCMQFIMVVYQFIVFEVDKVFGINLVCYINLFVFKCSQYGGLIGDNCKD